MHIRNVNLYNIYIYIYTNLPRNAIGRLSYFRSGNSQGQGTFYCIYYIYIEYFHIKITIIIVLFFIIFIFLYLILLFVWFYLFIPEKIASECMYNPSIGEVRVKFERFNLAF